MKAFYAKCKGCGKKIIIVPRMNHLEKMWRYGYRCDSHSVYCPNCVNSLFGGTGALDFEYTEEATRAMLINWWNNRAKRESIKRHVGRITAMCKDESTGKYIEF